MGLKLVDRWTIGFASAVIACSMGTGVAFADEMQATDQASDQRQIVLAVDDGNKFSESPAVVDCKQDQKETQGVQPSVSSADKSSDKVVAVLQLEKDSVLDNAGDKVPTRPDSQLKQPASQQTSVPAKIPAAGKPVQVPQAVSSADSKATVSKTPVKHKNQTIKDGNYAIQSTLGQSQMLDISGASKANGGNAQPIVGSSSNETADKVAKPATATAANVSSTPVAKPGVSAGKSNADGAAVAAATSEVKTVAPTKEQAKVDNGGVYVISSSLNTSKAVDVAGGSTQNGGTVQLYSKNTTAAQRWRFNVLSNGLYEIVNVNSGKALDVSGGNFYDGAIVQQYSRNNTKAQQWQIVATKNGMFNIVSALSSNYVLDLSGANTANGSTIQLWRANGTGAQAWRLDKQSAAVASGYYVIKNQGSGKALDIVGASVSDGGNAQQYSANSTMAQTFYLGYSSNTGYYTVQSANSGKALDVAGASDSNGANVWQYAGNGTKAQKWTISRNSDGTFTFLSAVGGKALDVSGAAKWNGANVQVYASNGTAAQKWILSSVKNWIPGGAYTVKSSLNVSNVVDLSSGSTANGTNVQVYSNNGSNAQRFYFTPQGDGSYAIQNTVSGKYVASKSSSSGSNVVLSSTAQYWVPVLTGNGIAFKSKANGGVVLDVSGASTRSGANLQVWSSNGSAAQRFYLTGTDFMTDGVYRVNSAQNSGYVLDIDSASTSDGAKLQLFQSNGTAAQLFYFKNMGGGTYRVTNVNSGKALTVSNGKYGVTQQAVSSSSSQKWRPCCASGAAVSLTNVQSGLRLNLTNGNIANGTIVGVLPATGSSAQKWVLVPSSTAYVNMSVSLRRMAQLQKQSSFYASLTVEQLMGILDPDNCQMYSFADLRVNTGATAAQLDAWIDSTWSGRNGMLHGMGAYFVDAAKKNGLNEVYLLAHAILESGWGTSKLATGTTYNNELIGSKRYTGTYYNFYGIGAYDSDANYYGGQAAAINGWNTPQSAVYGAAQWIAKNYISTSSYTQPTLYAMKWDYARTNATGERGWHQYATSTTWANSIGSLMSDFYTSYGMKDAITFIKPKY